MHKLLEGKKAIITGGTSGIGKAIAAIFLHQGATVLILGTNKEKAIAAVEEIKTENQHPGACAYCIVDVGNSAEVESNIKRQIQEWGNHIDILVNSAGITSDKLLLRMTEEDWSRVISVNLDSIFRVTKAVLPTMMKARSGKIINIASVIGVIGNPGQTNYAASKAGMIGFSRSLAKEVAKRGICVNTIAPGFIETPMTDKLTHEQRDSILHTVPIARFGKATEVANVALFLASELSSYVTGAVLPVDGGMLA
ncbi:MAG: 3-oxoacyl-[acyl-carrier-protein] reductase [Chlamydiales bacterium]